MGVPNDVYSKLSNGPVGGTLAALRRSSVSAPQTANMG